MKYLVKNKKLKLQYAPGKGAWTYHISIPGTKNLPVRWGYTKISGSIDGYEIKSKNLFSITGADKMISVNEQMRKTLGKGAGEMVVATFYLLE